MLHYHQHGVTLTLELQSAEELEQVQEGLVNALLRVAESTDELAGPVIQTLTQLLDAARLRGPQHEKAAAHLQKKPTPRPVAA